MDGCTCVCVCVCVCACICIWIWLCLCICTCTCVDMCHGICMHAHIFSQDVPDMYGQGSESSPRSGRPVYIASMSEASVVERRQALIGPEPRGMSTGNCHWIHREDGTRRCDINFCVPSMPRGHCLKNVAAAAVCTSCTYQDSSDKKCPERAVKPGRWSLMAQRMAMQCCSHASRKRSSKPRHIRSPYHSASCRSQTASEHK